MELLLDGFPACDDQGYPAPAPSPDTMAQNKVADEVLAAERGVSLDEYRDPRFQDEERAMRQSWARPATAHPHD